MTQKPLMRPLDPSPNRRRRSIAHELHAGALGWPPSDRHCAGAGGPSGSRSLCTLNTGALLLRHSPGPWINMTSPSRRVKCDGFGVGHISSSRVQLKSAVCKRPLSRNQHTCYMKALGCEPCEPIPPSTVLVAYTAEPRTPPTNPRFAQAWSSWCRTSSPANFLLAG